MQVISETMRGRNPVSAEARLRASGIDANRLARRLWIGSRPPLGDALVRRGFDVLVLCAEEYQPRSTQFRGLHAVLHAGIDDAVPSERELERAINAAIRTNVHIDRGRRVLVTCMAGLNRSALTCALVLHLRYGLDGREVVEAVRQRRRGAFTNQHFVRFLEGLR